MATARRHRRWAWTLVAAAAVALAGCSAGGSVGSGGGSGSHALVSAMRQAGLPGVHAYENYLAKQLPVLPMPQNDYQITAVKAGLRGATPQNPILNVTPENWSLGG